MRGKKFLVWILVLLFLIPAYVYATPSQTGRSVSSGTLYAPVKIWNNKKNKTSWGLTAFRNQISEMVRIKENADGYDISFLIGSYSKLQFVQIATQNESEAICKQSNYFSKKLPIGTFNLPDGWTAPTGSYTVSEDANERYYSDDEVKKELYNEAMDVGIITVHISDLSKPIIVVTSPTVQYNGANLVIYSALNIDTSNIFSFDEQLVERSMESIWMGEMDDKLLYATSRCGIKTDEDSIFDKNFDNQNIEIIQKDGIYQVSIPIKTVEGEDHMEKIEVAESRSALETTDGSMSDEVYKLNDYWANYQDAQKEDEKLILTYNSLEEMALGKIIRITTTSDQTANSSANSEGEFQYHIASVYIKPITKENVKKSVTDSETGITMQYWSNDYGDGSTFSVKENNSYFPEETVTSYRNFSKDYRIYTFDVLDENSAQKQSELNVEINIPLPDGWDVTHLMLARADKTGTTHEALSVAANVDVSSNTFTIKSKDGAYLNSTFLLYDAGSAENLTDLEDGLYKVKVSIMNATKPLTPSACNEGFSSTPAYIEKYKDNIDIYMLTGGVHFLGSYGYCSNIFTGDIDEDSKIEAEYLAYQTNAESSWTEWQTDKKTYSAHWSEKIKMPLKDAYTDEGKKQYCYLIGFYVPMMDVLQGGNPGSGDNRQPALLRVSNAEKVDENPLKNYENSAAMGEIDNLEYYIATEDGLSDEKKDSLTALFTEAKAEVQSWTEEQSSETIEKLIQRLRAAREIDPLKEGIYRIPLAEDSVKGLTVNAKVQDGRITLSLTQKNGETFTDVQYKGLFGDWQAAALSEDQKTASYTIAYTEEALPLSVDGTEGTLSLNFDEAMLTSADFTALDTAIAAAEEKLETEDSWTTSSFAALKTAYENAQALREDWSSEASAVAAQVNSLNSALDGLKARADLSDLKSELAEALKKAADKQYSESSRTALKDLVTEIRAGIREEADVSTEAAENYQNQLAEAVENLTAASEDKKDEETVSTNSLQSFVKDYKSWYQEADYTEASWAEFSQSLAEAESLAATELTETESEIAIEALMAARANLVRTTEDADEMAVLSQDVADAQEGDDVSLSGLIGYPSWVASVESANQAVQGKVLLSKGQASLLDYSLKTQFAAMNAELTAEAAYYELAEASLDEEYFDEYEEETEEETVNETEAEEDDFKDIEDSDAAEENASGSNIQKRSKKSAAQDAENSAASLGVEEESISLTSLEDEISLALLEGSEEGTYYVDYDLMQYSDPTKKSMGNNALDHGTEPGKMIYADGKWTLYMTLNSITAYEKEGKLQWMKRITAINTDENGYSVTGTKAADYTKDGEDGFPAVIGFVTDPSETTIPVQVFVPIAPEPTQEALIQIDWTSLQYINGATSIDSSLELSALNKAVKVAEALEEDDYTSASWTVVSENLKAAAATISSTTAGQDMVDARTEALNAAVEALLPLAEDEDYEDLDDAMIDALIADESDYSKNAWKELQSILSEAETLKSAEDVTPAMIDSMILDLQTAVARTGGGSSGDDSKKDESTGLKYSSLEALIKILKEYSAKDYTEVSFKQLTAALKSAEELLEKAKKNACSQSEIDDMVTLLKETRSSMQSATAAATKIDKSALTAMMNRAKILLANRSSYTTETVNALQAEYDLAEALLSGSSATQEKLEAQTLSLTAAIKALKESSSSGASSTTSSSTSSSSTSSSSSSDTKATASSKDGYYKVKVQLWHASKNQASAGAACISSPAYVMIEDGNIIMRLVTKKMNKSGITAHLGEGDFYIYEDGDYTAASLVSTEDSKWIHEFTLPNDTSTYYKCEVDPHVDVMGDEPVKARLKVTWSSKTKISESKWESLAGDVSDDDDDDDSSSTSTSTSTSSTKTSTTTTGTATTAAATGTTAASATGTAAATSNRSSSTASSKTASGSSKSSSRSSKTAAGSKSEKVTTIDGREIPYTGDTTPVTEMAAIGLVGALGAVWLTIDGKRRKDSFAAEKANEIEG